VTVDALSGSSVDDLAAASSAAGDAADGGTASLIGDWMESSWESGNEVAGSGGNTSCFDAPGVVPDDVEGVWGVEDVDVGVAEDDDGLPGWPAFSGLFSLMTVRQAPSTRTNEYALIIR
jgi:hypothetical protein